jgi:hypothetical protein
MSITPTLGKLRQENKVPGPSQNKKLPTILRPNYGLRKIVICLPSIGRRV